MYPPGWQLSQNELDEMVSMIPPPTVPGNIITKMNQLLNNKYIF